MHHFLSSFIASGGRSRFRVVIALSTLVVVLLWEWDRLGGTLALGSPMGMGDGSVTRNRPAVLAIVFSSVGLSLEVPLSGVKHLCNCNYCIIQAHISTLITSSRNLTMYKWVALGRKRCAH